MSSAIFRLPVPRVHHTKFCEVSLASDANATTSLHNGGKHGQGRSDVGIQRALEDRVLEAQGPTRRRGGGKGGGERRVSLGPFRPQDGATDPAARGARARGRRNRRGGRQGREGPPARGSRRALLGRELRQVSLLHLRPRSSL